MCGMIFFWILNSWDLTCEALNLLSYLTDGLQFVNLGGANSCARFVRNVLFQGSVLGPLLFIVYTSRFTKSILHEKFICMLTILNFCFDYLMGDFDTAAVRITADVDQLALIAKKIL